MKDVEWWKKPVRVFQFNLEDPYGFFIKKFDAETLVNLARRMRANVLVIFARDAWGRRLYLRGKVAPQHPRLTEKSSVEKLVEEARKFGIKVVIMVAHTANKYMYEKHPDWAQVNAKGEVIVLEHIPSEFKIRSPQWPLLCINSPYIQYLEEEVSESIKATNPDGVLLDSFRYQPDFNKACYCDYCQIAFTKETGLELPEEENWETMEWREAWKWRYRVVVRAIARLRNIVKKYNPNLVYMYNSHPAGWAGRANKVVEDLRDVIDVVFAECSEADHQPPGFISEMVRLTKAMSGGKPVWASRNAFYMYRTVTSATPIVVKQGLREALIAGGSPWVLFFSSTLTQDSRVLDAVAEVYKEIEEMEDYLIGLEEVKYVGIVASNATRDWYGKSNPAVYVDETRGFYYALVNQHIPVGFIADTDLANVEKLSQYSTVILANTACVSDKSIGALKKYVEEGGGIVATYQATTLDMDGVDREDFGISELLGAHYEGVLSLPWSYVILERNGFKKVHSIVPLGDMDYAFKNKRSEEGLANQVRAKVESEKVKVIGRIALAAADYGFEYTLGRSTPPIGIETMEPSIIVSEDKVFYFSFQLGRHYWRIGHPDYLNMIVESTLYVAKDPPPIETNAPETVEVSLFKRDNELYFIHLLNHTYNQRILSIPMGASRQTLPGYSQPYAVHPPRRVNPISNIRIKLKLGKDWEEAKIVLPLRKAEKKVKIKNNEISYTLPILNEYEAIVIEKTY